MKKKSRNWIYSLAVITLVLILANGCKKDGNTLVVNTHAVLSITSTSATFEGDVVSSGGDDSFDLGFCCSNVTTEPDYPENLCGVSLNLNMNNFKGVVESLTPGTTYYVRAYAINGNGIAYGKVVSFTTTGSVTGDIVFNPDLTYGLFSDIDGNSYKTIQIGTQTWMAENLKTTKYNDGTVIPNVTGQDEWSKLTTGAYCWYINQSVYKNVYGALYNWYTVKTGKLCPSSWHVPSDAEWTTLINYVGNLTGDEDLAGVGLKETGLTHWMDHPSYVSMFDATNVTGFTALPGGYRGSEKAFFLQENLGYNGLWWSSTESDWEVDNIWIRTMNYLFNGVGRQSQGAKRAGLSCRCIKD